jgi:MerR family transcriptional regulator, light-induced transcriptional regulator
MDDSPVQKIGRAYAEALLSGDEVAAEVAIREALSAKLSTAQIDEQIIAPALWLVGELWQRKEISIAEEHIATEISIRVLALQREAARLANQRVEHRVMLATPSGEQHVIALRMVHNLLREAGYDALMLGSDVPPPALASAARRHHPDVLCLSATMAGGSDQVLVAIHEVQLVAPDTAFIVGGRGLTSRVQAGAGIAICERVSDVVGAVDALIKRADLN